MRLALPRSFVKTVVPKAIESGIGVIGMKSSVLAATARSVHLLRLCTAEEAPHLCAEPGHREFGMVCIDSMKSLEQT